MNDLLDGDGLVECGDCGDVTNDFRVNIDTYGIICHPCWLERRAERAEADLAAANARAEAAEQRVAELEAAQSWQPVSEKPPADGYYQTATLNPPVVDHAHYSVDGNWYYRYGHPEYWRPIPPPPDATP